MWGATQRNIEKVGLLYHFLKRMKLSHRFLRESGQIQNINI